jgi:adenylate kinase family enzyme
LPVIHLDKLHWKPGWVEPPEDEWRHKVEEVVKGESWIIDGNYGGTMDVRLAACDTVIFLDFPRSLCTWRIIRRWLTYRNGIRPDMGDGCPEKMDREFLSWVWYFPKDTKPRIEDKLLRFGSNAKVIRLRSPGEVKDFIVKVTS